MAALFNSSVPVRHDSVTVNQHEQHQDSETEAAKWNSANINFIIYACAFPAVTCQNIFSEKGLGEHVRLNWFFLSYMSYTL